MEICGQVAKILDEYTLVLNRGSSHGVKPGMVFAVYTPVEEVRDPESGESLGKWELVKARLVARHVQEKLTVCSAEERESLPAGERETHTLSAELVAAFMTAGRRGREKLPVERGALSGAPQARPVSVGDSVRSV